jgi:cyanophycin synthetase
LRAKTKRATCCQISHRLAGWNSRIQNSTSGGFGFDSLSKNSKPFVRLFVLNVAMQICEFRVLRGPNIWANSPVTEAWVELGEFAHQASNEMPGFNGRLMAMLPTMIEHRCSVGERGGFFQRLRRGTYLAHILEHVAIELHSLAGVEIGYGKTRETAKDGLYRVVIKHDDEELCQEALRTGVELCMAAVHDQPFDVAGEVKRLHELAERVCLGPSTRAVVAAAKEKNIPVRRLNVGSLVLLGQGVHARRMWTAESDRTSAIAETIASDKDLTKSLLRAAGIPVPEGRQVESAEDAWEETESLGSAVVVKPLDANHGRGVFTGLTEKAEVELAFAEAEREGNGVIVERFVSGSEHRLLVVGGKLVAAARGDYAYVVGDGRNTIADLVESQLNSDPRRGDDESCPLNRVNLDSANCVTLEQQGYRPSSVPLNHVKVLIQRSDNLATDVTDLVHSDVTETAIQVARVVGLDIAGVDIVARDISLPLEAQGGIVVEVNSGPGLLMHLFPARGQSRPVGEAIINTLFGEGADGRIPVVAVAGSHGAALATRLIEHLWKPVMPQLGIAASYGTYLGTRSLRTGNSATHQAQQNILINPKAQAALFELTTGNALGEGLGFDRCQIGVLLNIDPTEDIASWCFDDVDRLVQAKRVAVDIVLPTGFAVLNAGDALAADAVEHTKGTVVYFAADAGNTIVAEHVAQGGTAVILREKNIELLSGNGSTAITTQDRLPWLNASQNGEADCGIRDALLGAVAVAWLLGVPADALRAGLESFQPPAEQPAPEFAQLQN